VAEDRQRRYRIDPADHFAAIRQARATAAEIVGVYHSHPHSAPVPSETDRTEAFESFLFVIVGPSDTRAWRLVAGNFTEVPLVRLP
jgi:proteasome lid subunit RPN8/RPN11